MKLLLDTHAFLWWESKDKRLPRALAEAIADPRNEVFVSAASVWEIAIKRMIGKLAFAGSVAKTIERNAFLGLSIRVEHAEYAGSLPQLHRDPFDRLLVSQTVLDGLVLATVDDLILQYPVTHLEY